MPSTLAPDTAIKTQLLRQVNHWMMAISRLHNLDDLASPEAWHRLERYLGVSIRHYLTGIVNRLQRQGKLLQATLEAAEDTLGLANAQSRLLAFRHQYLRAETTLDFYTDAINTRTNANLAGLLRACDTLANRSMTQILDQLGKESPPILTYIDKGLGAAILKAGLRLWDGGTESPVAVIKIVRHNLLCPTSLIHEAGHQVAHICDWNTELAATFEHHLPTDPSLARVWASWASEIAADAIAFVHTGYGSVAALHDVIAGERTSVLRYIPGDPHPISYLRVLLGVEMCRHFYGLGPWDELAFAWQQRYPLEAAGRNTPLLAQSVLLLKDIARLTLDTPMQAFAGRKLSDLVNPERVKPSVLEELEHRLGTALYTSMHWIWTEALRGLALTSLRVATNPNQEIETLTTQENWMLKLGGAIQAT